MNSGVLAITLTPEIVVILTCERELPHRLRSSMVERSVKYLLSVEDSMCLWRVQVGGAEDLHRDTLNVVLALLLV